MKKRSVFWALPAVLLAFGLVLAGCDDKPSGEDKLTVKNACTFSIVVTYVSAEGSGNSKEPNDTIAAGASKDYKKTDTSVTVTAKKEGDTYERSKFDPYVSGNATVTFEDGDF